jgi:mono/diheme cytochrome c family protein
MSPFSATNGGPLSDEEVDAIVAFLRSWEANPPVELPPEVSVVQTALTGAQAYVAVCSRCHGLNGEGGIGPALADPQVQGQYDDQGLFDTISLGHDATEMIAWGEVLTPDQIEQLVRYIRGLQPITVPPEAATPSFANDILPILDEECYFCHSARKSSGGWDGSTYEAVMTTGEHAPVVVPGNSRSSVLAQKITGVPADGEIMPPPGLMSEERIQLIIDWINAGAPNN